MSNVTNSELELLQREIKVMFAAQERKLEAHHATAARLLSDLADSVRELSGNPVQVEKRFAAIESLLTSRRMD